VNRWIRYGVPLIPAMLLAVVMAYLFGGPSGPMTLNPFGPPLDRTWMAIGAVLVVATYALGVVALRRTRPQRLRNRPHHSVPESAPR
jgi:hypothetical protein